MENIVSHDAQVETWGDFLRGLLTEPMTQKECSEQFGICRRTMKTILDLMEGIQIFPGGRMMRIPLREMPPEHLVSRGVFPPPRPTTLRNAESQPSNMQEHGGK